MLLVVYSTAYAEGLYDGLFQDNVASSSRSYLRSFFTEMGYSPSLVNRVIEENGIVMNGHKHSSITLFFDRIGNGL